MTNLPILESGMTFGPYPAGHCFYIEKSTLYKNIESGVKMAEFLLLRLSHPKPPVIWIVEAKSSTPHPGSQAQFDTFIAELREKLSNAFFLGMAACLKRHQEAALELPESFRNLDLAATDFRFILVINGHPLSWLPPLQEALQKALQSTIKTWALSPTAVAVINGETARSRGLILPA